MTGQTLTPYQQPINDIAPLITGAQLRRDQRLEPVARTGGATAVDGHSGQRPRPLTTDEIRQPWAANPGLLVCWLLTGGALTAAATVAFSVDNTAPIIVVAGCLVAQTGVVCVLVARSGTPTTMTTTNVTVIVSPRWAASEAAKDEAERKARHVAARSNLTFEQVTEQFSRTDAATESRSEPQS